NPNAVSPCSAASRWSGCTGSGTYTQSSPNAANAALWIAGERLCDTGQPMMPSVRVDPATRAPGGGSPKALGLVGQELVVADAEPVRAVAAAQDVVEVRHVGRGEG